MPNDPQPPRMRRKINPTAEAAFSRRVGEQAARKIRAQKRTIQGVWFGLGMMGLVGWSIAAPTLAGVALGIWIDDHYPGSHSWTLALLVAGLCIGCANAWHWITKEESAIREEQQNQENQENQENQGNQGNRENKGRRDD